MSKQVQTELPGAERERIQAIDDAALEWRAAIEAKNRADAQIEESRGEINALMREHGITKYRVIDGEWERILTYVTKGAVKMRKPKRSEEDE